MIKFWCWCCCLVLATGFCEAQFIRGFFACDPQTDASFEMIKAAGGDYVHSYSGSAAVAGDYAAAQKILPRASYCVAPDGGFTLGINFSCLETERPGYGYAGVVDSYAGEHHSPHDGIYRIDIATGKSRLIISLDDIVGIQTEDSMLIRKNWFNHLLISPDGGRFAFFHRWRQANGGHLTRMHTAQCDGGNIYLLNPDNMTSHYCWIDPAHIIAYAHRFGAGNHYYKFTDLSRDYEIIGGRLYDDDGHCSISPDKQWMLTDTYPDRDHFRTLILHHLAENRRMDIGRFFSVPDWDVPERCDLHPRWSRDGQKIFFDSSHEHSRQIYMIDLKELQ